MTDPPGIVFRNARTALFKQILSTKGEYDNPIGILTARDFLLKNKESGGFESPHFIENLIEILLNAF